MQEGDVVLASIPTADGAPKNRPVILLRQLPPFGDFLVCGVSTQLQQEVADFDERIGPASPDFSGSGLKSESLIRLGYLATLARASIPGSLGFISAERHHRLLRTLAGHLTP
jgi:mRNA interferase MazF